MNAITTHTIAGVDIVRLPGNRATLSGPTRQVAMLLDWMRAAGTLATASDPVPNGHPGHIVTTVRLLPPRQVNTTRPARSRPVRSRRALVGIAFAVTLAILAPLVALGVALWLALTWLAAHILPVLDALALLLVLAGLVAPRACTTVITITHRH